MRGMTRADLISAVLLGALGLAVVVESWRMPRLESLDVNPWSVPGLVPGLIGAVLLLLATALLVRSLLRLRRGDSGAALPELSARRLLLAAALTLGYAAGLVGRLPFWLATFLFVTGFIVLFEWQGAASRPRTLGVAVIEGALAAAVVTAVFRYVFLVRLP